MTAAAAAAAPPLSKFKNPLVSHALEGVSRDIVVQQKLGVESTKKLHRRDLALEMTIAWLRLHSSFD